MRTVDSKFEFLRSLEVLADLPDRQLRDLAFRVDEVELPVGETLIHEGQLNRHAYFVGSGLLEIDVDGHSVATVGAGSIVGERSAIERELANATVTVVAPARVFAVDHRVLLGAASLTEAFGDHLQDLAAERTNRAA